MYCNDHIQYRPGANNRRMRDTRACKRRRCSKPPTSLGSSKLAAGTLASRKIASPLPKLSECLMIERLRGRLTPKGWRNAFLDSMSPAVTSQQAGSRLTATKESARFAKQTKGFKNLRESQHSRPQESVNPVRWGCETVMQPCGHSSTSVVDGRHHAYPSRSTALLMPEHLHFSWLLSMARAIQNESCLLFRS